MSFRSSKKDRGMSLIEIMIAVGVFTLGVMAGAHFIIEIHKSSVNNLEKKQAVFLAREGVEALRSIPYTDLEGSTEPEGYTLVMRGRVEEMGSASEIDV